MPSLAGQRLDKYDMLEEVGHGGMAVVYRGKDTDLDREVAVKVLHAHLADREESRMRLRREAITVAKLRHDNIVEIYDYSGPSATESYIVTEFIHGRTLREWLDGEWSPRPALAALLIHRLCLPLQHAHDLGIVHRDIKPENVMIRRDGCLKLMDFGIAQLLDHQKLTMTGQLLGSPAYMAPELISGKPIDKRTDLFAVGIMLYQLATGQLPFTGRNPHEVLNRIADAEYERASRVNPMVDEDLDRVIAKALARSPDDRFQDAQEMANELEEYLGGLGIEPAPEALEHYFEAPQQYVDELDRNICAVLLGKAERATRDGNSARALKMLSRVLEIEPDNKKAASMLDAAKIRGQRMRQLLMVGGLVALVGFVAAGVMLVRPDPNAVPEDPVVARRQFQQVEWQRVGLAVSAGSARVGPPQIEHVGADADTEGLPDESGTGGDTPPRKALGLGPLRVRSKKCVVRVKNPPVPSLQHLKLMVAGKSIKLDRKGEAIVSITGSQVATLSGQAWEGKTTVHADTCQGRVTELEARAQDPFLEIRESNVDLKRLTVTCVKGCTRSKKMTVRDDKVGPLSVPTGSDSWPVTLQYRAEGFDSLTKARTLYPGRNPIDIELKPN